MVVDSKFINFIKIGWCSVKKIIVTSFLYFLNATRLRRARTVVRNRRHVFDGKQLDAAGGERADSRFASGTDPLHDHGNFLDPVLLSLLGKNFSDFCSCERRAFLGSGKSERSA